MLVVWNLTSWSPGWWHCALRPPPRATIAFGTAVSVVQNVRSHECGPVVRGRTGNEGLEHARRAWGKWSGRFIFFKHKRR